MKILKVLENLKKLKNKRKYVLSNAIEAYCCLKPNQFTVLIF